MDCTITLKNLQTDAITCKTFSYAHKHVLKFWKKSFLSLALKNFSFINWNGVYGKDKNYLTLQLQSFWEECSNTFMTEEKLFRKCRQIHHLLNFFTTHKHVLKILKKNPFRQCLLNFLFYSKFVFGKRQEEINTVMAQLQSWWEETNLKQMIQL